jgi:hypothetical protein
MQEPINIWNYKWKIIYKSDNFEIVLPDIPRDERLRLQKIKEEVRNRWREIVEKYMRGEIDDLEKFLKFKE